MQTFTAMTGTWEKTGSQQSWRQLCKSKTSTHEHVGHVSLIDLLQE